jgi:hypothetical protein
LKRHATSSLLKLVGVDLVERRVLAAAQIGGVHRPLAVLRARLSGRLAADARRERGRGRCEKRRRKDESDEDALHKTSPDFCGL